MVSVRSGDGSALRGWLRVCGVKVGAGVGAAFV